MSTRVLVVDDDEPLRDMVAEYLAERDFAVDVAADGDVGLERACSGEYALLVLDVRMPALNGFEVLRRLRAANGGIARLPVIMLTAHGDEIDRIVGLELGADDYLAKPFNPRELLARIRAVLRRTTTGDSGSVETVLEQERETPPLAFSDSSLLKVGDLKLDADARTVLRNGEMLDLSATEFDLLHALFRQAGRVVSREDLAREALGRRLLPLERSLDIHVCKLRHKLWPGDEGLNHIRTVRGVGYVLVKDTSPT